MMIELVVNKLPWSAEAREKNKTAVGECKDRMVAHPTEFMDWLFTTDRAGSQSRPVGVEEEGGSAPVEGGRGHMDMDRVEFVTLTRAASVSVYVCVGEVE